ncbi:MAG: hypothetical protein B1H11_12235 [Desulfobacteraceae bacterium 4484_190.1]|nr:MAG: hypothetical protein B1H11_12235 [Desulfobacteraceae bacterium 4484_190.1]
MHGTLGLLEEIRDKHHPDIDNIEKVEIETGPVAFTAAGNKSPVIGREIKFSLWFLAALALIEENVGLDKFVDEKLHDPRVVNLRNKVDAHLVDALGFGARVSVIMKDGTEYKDYRRKQKGHPENPLSVEELENKFGNAAKMSIPENNINLLIDKIKSIEKVDDITEIMDLMR